MSYDTITVWGPGRLKPHVATHQLTIRPDGSTTERLTANLPLVQAIQRPDPNHLSDTVTAQVSMCTLTGSLEGAWRPDLLREAIQSVADPAIPVDEWLVVRLDAPANTRVTSIPGTLTRAARLGRHWVPGRLTFQTYATRRGQTGVMWRNSRREIVIYDKHTELQHLRSPLAKQASNLLRLEVRLKRASTLRRLNASPQVKDIQPELGHRLTQQYAYLLDLAQTDEDRRAALILSRLGWRRAAVLLALDHLAPHLPPSTLRRYLALERSTLHESTQLHN